MAKHLHAALCLLLLAGCGNKPPAEDMAATEDLATEEDLAADEDLRPVNPVDRDLRVPEGDMRTGEGDMLAGPDLRMPGLGPVGAPCTDDSKCGDGPAPVCWKATVRNQMGAAPTPGGYCSSACIADSDCGGGGARCVSVGGSPFCLAGCNNAMTCRHAGYACAYHERAGVCFPDTIFDCDPKMAACTEGGAPGGCVRGAYEDKGRCSRTCTVGAGTCPALGGEARQCVFYESKPDPFRGGVCLKSPAAPKGTGAACGYINECADGYQCDGADGKCRKLCVKAGMPACTMPETCMDPWMTGAGGAGICR